MAVTKSTPSDSITVRDNRTGKTIDIPITHNSIPATAFKSLVAPQDSRNPSHRDEDDFAAGLRIYDPAFMNTAALSSKITYIDGEKGTLMHRGYPIEQLAEKSNFLEVAYLLIYGELPNRPQSERWQWEIMHHTFLSDDLSRMMQAHRYDAHPMAIFASTFSAMSAFSPEANPALQVLPRSDLSYTENMLFMMDHMNEPSSYVPDPRLAKALDVLFVLHADHEMNCSTAAMTHVGSSLVDPYSAIAAAACALYGPLHGGANEAVIRMLQGIGSVDKVPAFIEGVKNRKQLLFGFGHRIYKNTDPRSKIIREVADTVFEIIGAKEPLIEVAIALKDAALNDPWFQEKKLYPNVDYWSGLVYKALGFPLDFFPVLFAVPRVAGWIAHWKQQIDSGTNKIARPRQLYIGEKRRDYVPLDQREDTGEPKDSRVGLKELPHYMSKRKLLPSAKL
ncbi:hypothetical protein TWF569_008006 [Orbilia oligospora]|nr:hypothetical protein TWF569_008006 [Orbilia oligospora]